jgi:EpsI family protein
MGPSQAVPEGAKPLRPFGLLLTLAALGAAPAIWAATGGTGPPMATPPSLSAPAAPPGWSAETSPASRWRPAYHGADGELHVRYRTDDGTVDLWLLLYVSQAQGKELVSGENRIADSGNWSIDSHRRLSSDPPMNEAELTGLSGSRRIVRWWYEVGGWNSAGPIGAKLRQVAGRLTGRPEAGLVAFSAPCAPDCDRARDRLDRFSAAAAGALRAAIYEYRFEGDTP